jgi:hypothetical protein
VSEKAKLTAELERLAGLASGMSSSIRGPPIWVIGSQSPKRKRSFSKRKTKSPKNFKVVSTSYKRLLANLPSEFTLLNLLRKKNIEIM